MEAGALDQIAESVQAIAKIAGKKSINAPSLAGGGKLHPAGSGSTKKPEEKCACGKAAGAAKECKCAPGVAKELRVEITKASDEEQTITGIVLEPETVDGHGDIYSAEVVREAAHKFLAGYNRRTKLGRQHKDFKRWTERLSLVESYVAPIDFVLGDRLVKAGSWIVTVKVLDSAIWKMVKDKKITGFSIGGKAKVQDLTAAA